MRDSNFCIHCVAENYAGDTVLPLARVRTGGRKTPKTLHSINFVMDSQKSEYKRHS